MAKILLVGYVHELIKERNNVLCNGGHEVTLATKVQDAFQAAKQEMFDVAVLEFSVPEQERNQLAQAIKSKRHNTKIIMLYFARPGHTEFADVLIEANVRPESLPRAVNYILTNAEKPGDDHHRCF
jgi:DNA-binding NtrC family response regulator